MSESSPPSPDDAAHSPEDDDPLVDLALRVAGGVIAVVAAVVTAAAELILSTLRVGGTLIGLAALIAVVANVLLSRFAYVTVGRKWAVALPAVAWFVVIFIAATGTAEGDIGLAANNWVGLAIVTLGSLTFGVMAFRLITASVRR
ncbi:MAG TPA: hypothetical protein VHN18_01230 [Micromonosporaceae bacterium]|nr:hypothetical protein [Micromonosporaceae bacterium]